jgi:hypothetical protein
MVMGSALPYLTLPYLTLPYLTLPYLTLPYLELSTLITLPALIGFRLTGVRHKPGQVLRRTSPLGSNAHRYQQLS